MPRRKKSPPPPSRGAAAAAVSATVAALKLAPPPVFQGPGPMLPTMSSALDKVLDMPGWPISKVVELYGPEAVGKTTLALHVAARVQQQGGIVAVIDVEHALDLHYAKALGVDINNLLISQPGSEEMALTVLARLVSSGGLNFVILDSVAALVPQAELDGGLGSVPPNLQRQLLATAMPVIAAAAEEKHCGVLLINQIRDAVGAPPNWPQVYSPGGRAVHHWASVRLSMWLNKVIVKGGATVGIHSHLQSVRNLYGQPGRSALLSIVFDPPSLQ